MIHFSQYNRSLGCIFIIFFCLALLSFTSFGQDLDLSDSTRSVGQELVQDSIQSDTTHQQAPANKGDIETTINYDANDSIFFDLSERKLYLYGETHIDYGIISLEAERTNVDWEKSMIQADYITDSTGAKVGKPVFSEGADTYVANKIVYNFKSKRALIKDIITEQDGAFMHGQDVKKNEDNELFIRGAKYTTCNLEYPHFFIESKKLKAIPGNKIVSGPFNVKFRDLPTPLFLPFGMFPQPRKKASGVVVPTYGEEKLRGFFLRDGGYFFAINDYVDLRVTGDIYSKGGNGMNVTSNYLKRYSYRGTFNFSYNKSLSGSEQNPLETNDYWVRWNHAPESRRNSSFSASVSAGTSTFNQNNNLVNQDFNRSINSQLTSSVSYRTKFRGTPFNMALDFRYNQNLQTEIVNLTLPDLTLNMNRIYPFKKLIKSTKSLLTKLNFSHNFIAKNELTNRSRSSFAFPVTNANADANDTLAFNFNNLDKIYARSRVGGRHNIPISTSLNLLKYFTLNPSFSYQELWYLQELRYTYIESEKAVRIDTVRGFSRAGSWTTGASLNTRIYGTKFFKKGKIQAIRHVITPGLSFSYSPDFSDPKYGVFNEVQVDPDNTRKLSKYEGFAYGSPSQGESKTIGLSLSNNIEMKVLSRKDTITGSKKIKLFDNIGLSTGYNLAADSFKLSNISLNARTSFFNGKVSLNLTGSIDPYLYEFRSESVTGIGQRNVDQRRLDRFAWNNGQGIGQLSRMTTSIGINLRPKSREGGDRQKTKDFDNFDPGDPNPGDLLNDLNDPNQSPEDKGQLSHIRNNPEEYVDFNVPWSLTANYSINRNKTGFQDAQISQSLSFRGSLGLTEKTQISFNSGYDFENKQFTSTALDISRDLHCWTMSVTWIPFGRFQSYSVSIRVKSSLLQDLKIEKRRSFLDFFN